MYAQLSVWHRLMDMILCFPQTGTTRIDPHTERFVVPNNNSRNRRPFSLDVHTFAKVLFSPPKRHHGTAPIISCSDAPQPPLHQRPLSALRGRRSADASHHTSAVVTSSPWRG